MRLDLTKNPALLRGVEHLEDGAVRRFAADSGVTGYMAECAPGARIALRTNARRLQLELLIPPPHVKCYHASVDVTVNQGEIVNFCAPDDEPSAPPRPLTVELELPGKCGGDTVEIFLPNQRGVKLGELELEGAGYASPRDYPGEPLLFLGDSITQGFFADPGRTWAALTARRLNADWFNLGIGGAWMPGANYHRPALALPWRSAFVAYGVNDCNGHRELDDFRTATRDLLAALSSRSGARIFLLTPLPWLNGLRTGRGAELEQFRAALTAVGAEFPAVRVVPGEKLVAAAPELFEDGCHPTNAGMAEVAAKLADFLV